MNSSLSQQPRWLRNSLPALMFVGLGLGAWMLVHRAHQSQDHHDHDELAAAMTLNDGRRWETDLPLRTGMQRIRDAVEQVSFARANNSLSPADAKALSATVQENVNYLIANCKLPPKADATLHVLITELLSGAAHLAEKPAAQEGLEQMERALRRYSEYFDHPGWVMLDASKRG